MIWFFSPFRPEDHECRLLGMAENSLVELARTRQKARWGVKDKWDAHSIPHFHFDGIFKFKWTVIFSNGQIPIQYLFFSRIFLLLCHFHFLSLCIILLDEEESSSIIRPSGVSPSLFNFRLSYSSEGNSWLRSSLSAFFCLLSFLDNFLVFTWHLQRLRKNLSLILLRRSGEVHRPN